MREIVDAGGGHVRFLPDAPREGTWEPAADLAYGEKIEVLRDYVQRYGLRTMIETGLYNGNGSGMQMRDLIDNYIVIDISPEQVAAARSKGATSLCGDSATWMGAVLGNTGVLLELPGNEIIKSALFWLDAHLVAEAGEENSSSLSGELDAILAWPHAARSVVLIDDVRMMGREGWPTLAEVLARCEPMWDVLVETDIVRCTPK